MTGSLTGKHIVNTRAIHQAAEFDDLIRARGATPIPYPCIAIKPPEDTTLLDAALKKLVEGYFDWLVLTSVNTVWSIAQRLQELNLTLADQQNFKTAAIGSSTQAAAEAILNLNVALTPDEFIAESLAEAVLRREGQRIFLPTSSIARPTLVQRLADGDTEVCLVDAYQTVRGQGGADVPGLINKANIHAITFTSSSTVQFFIERLQDEGESMKVHLKDLCIACIGPKTSKTAEEFGLKITVEATPYTLEGLLDSLDEYFKVDGDASVV